MFLKNKSNKLEKVGEKEKRILHILKQKYKQNKETK